MRHRQKGKTLGRDMDHRKALLRNLSVSLIEHESIETTLAKAKYLRPFVERLITRARKGYSFNNLRYLRKKIHSETAIKKLFDEVGPRYTSRPGGYTRITKIGNRAGDNAPLARIELVKVTKSKKDEEKKDEKVEQEKKITTTKRKTTKKKKESKENTIEKKVNKTKTKTSKSNKKGDNKK